MHWAADRNILDVVELLIRYGADVNARDKVSTTIHHAYVLVFMI